MKEVHALETGKFVFKEKNGLLLTEIGNYFEIDSNERPHNHFARHARTPRFICNSQTGEKLIEFGGVQLWKNIPAEIKSSDFYNIFKKKPKRNTPLI